MWRIASEHSARILCGLEVAGSGAGQYLIFLLQARHRASSLAEIAVCLDQLIVDSARYIEDAITRELQLNILSNAYQLMRHLVELGYICRPCKVNVAPRQLANRRRAWLPCVGA